VAASGIHKHTHTHTPQGESQHKHYLKASVRDGNDNGVVRAHVHTLS